MRAFVLLAGLVLLILGFRDPARAQKSEGALRWASHAPVTAIDPYSNAHREAMLINGQLVWDTLAYRDPNSGECVPLLAKWWRWADDVTLGFVLRDDVKWHGGPAVTAAASAAVARVSSCAGGMRSSNMAGLVSRCC